MGQTIGYRAAQLRICVDDREQGHLRGYVASQRLKRPLPFNDIGDLLLLLDDVLDRQKFPLAFQRKRSFQPQEPLSRFPEIIGDDYMTAEAVDASFGKLTTFVLSVVSRLNTSWQGRLDWLDGKPVEQFSSALALVKMVDERVSAL